jgi:SAM-dependent methyltransferase
MGERRGDYGIDAPAVPVFLALSVLVLLIVGAVVVRRAPVLGAVVLLAGAAQLMSTASYLYTTLAGKFSVWSYLLDGLVLGGDEQLLDMGCGRGAVLMMAARRLSKGQAVGLDLWITGDQLGNSLEAARRNAAAEGLSERVQLKTGDMSAMPFADASFDVVVSNMAIHNIKDRVARLKAIDEAVRVLKPGGRLLIADIVATGQYVERLEQLDMDGVSSGRLGWRMWYGNPWIGPKLVAAVKPA